MRSLKDAAEKLELFLEEHIPSRSVMSLQKTLGILIAIRKKARFECGGLFGRGCEIAARRCSWCSTVGPSPVVAFVITELICPPRSLLPDDFEKMRCPIGEGTEPDGMAGTGQAGVPGQIAAGMDGLL